MAYEKETETLLAGTVNVLAPGDLLQETEALRILNFRADNIGTLQSRQGDTTVQASSSGPVTSISLLESATPARFFGAGGSLYENGVVIGNRFGTNTPISMVSFQGNIFATTDALQAKTDGSSFWEWQIAAPALGGTASVVAVSGALMVGTYHYFISLVCADGSESTVAAPIVIVVALGQGVMLASFPRYTPPTGFDDPTIGVNIYRGGGTQTSTVLIHQLLFSSGVTTYTDSESDLTTQASNSQVLLATDYDPPPPMWGVVGPYYDRLIGFGSVAHPNRLWWTPPLQPYAWPGAVADDGNWVDVGKQGEWILAVTVRPNSITIYKEKSIWRVFGDIGETSAILEQTSTIHGLVGRQAVASTGAIDYAGFSEGIFAWNGEKGTKLSPGLNPIFYGTYPDIAPANVAIPMETGSRGLMALGFLRGQLYVSYPTQGQTGTPVNNATLVYDTQTGKWVEDSRGFNCFFDEGQKFNFLGGLAAGTTAIAAGIDDHGAAIAVDYFSRFSNQKTPEQDKTYSDLTIECNTNGSLLNVTAYLDNGLTSVVMGILYCTARQEFVMPYGSDGLGVRARNHAIRITGSVQTSPGPVSNPLPCFLYKATLHFIVQPRFSRTFDSDVTDLGIRDVKFCDFLEFDIDLQGNGTGVYTWTVYSDRPSVASTGSAKAAVTARATGTFTDNSLLGRRPIRIQLTEFEGQLMRVTLSANANGSFLLYAARMRVRPIGIYLDGGNGETFITKEIGLGI